ncbi:MAG TPA: PAS domain-containing protein [Kofleriaceae bacterium]|nr:PAS domain-containing protein [Kofleriaceae bacterium]
MDEQQLFRQALVHSPEGVSVYELDGTLVWMNPATERMMGVSLAELQGKRIFELYPDGLGTPFHAAFLRVVEGAPAQQFEQYYPRFDGWYSLCVVRVGDRVHAYARETTTDIRHRRRLETLARISEVVTADEQATTSTARAVSQIITDVIDADCTIALLSDDSQWLEVSARTSKDSTTLELMNTVMRWPSDTGTPGDALRTRQVVLVAANPKDVTTDHTPELRQLVARYQPSAICVGPLVVGDAAIGVIIVTRREGRPPLTEDDRALMSAIGPSVALYIALARRRAESAIAQQRLGLVADSLPALVAFIDRDERYQYVNATYAAWLGARASDVIGKRPRDMFRNEYPAIEEFVRRALAGETVRFRTRFAYPTGVREVDAQYVPVHAPSGEQTGFAVLVQDISGEARIAELERERLEAERNLNARLQAFLSVTGQLAGATTTDDIARILVDEGVRALDASIAGLWLRSGDDAALTLVRHANFRPEFQRSFARVPIAASEPLGDCVLSGKPVFISSRTEYVARYPSFESTHRPDPSPPISFALLPLAFEGRVAGCINFSFHDERRLTADERTYLELLASHGAEALRRAKVASELREVSETREAMIHASPAAIAVTDGDAIVRVWNPAAETILGVSAADAIGKPHMFAADPAWRRDLDAVLAGNTIHGRQVRRVRRDGTLFDVELYAAPVALGDGRVVALSMVVDVTERKRVERGRQMIANATTIFNRSLDLEETLRQIVRVPLGGWAEWCGVDILGDDGMLDRISLSLEDSGPRLPARLAHDPRYSGSSSAIARRETFILRDATDEDLQTIARNADHLRALRMLRLRSVLSVPLVAGERVLGAITIGTSNHNFDDLDASILAELATLATTAIENARLYKDAQLARGEAEAASRAKDEFMAMLGHELRNPLAPIVTALDLMQLRAPGQFERERAVIGRQVHHLSRLVDDLLDVSRITRGKVELHKERLAVAAIVAKAIEQASPLLEQKNHRLVIDVPYDLHVYGDPLRLAQIVSNLVGNAAKYTPDAGLVEVSARGEGDRVVLTVRDNGIGITPEMLPHVFDMFVQAPQSSSRPAGGLGLGLTIVKSLVDMHGGTVRVESAGKNKGSSFSVSLPIATERIAVVESAALMQIACTAVPRRILVVDDNEDAAMLLASVLEAHGHDVRTAFDGPSALRIANEFQPEIAVLDIGLPVMDGYELAERLLTEFAGVRLIAVSGYGQESDRARTRAAGFQAHLAKPVPIDALVRLVDESS